MIEVFKPNLDDLWFRQMLLADSETMSYNNAWGGTIPFPREEWSAWYRHWLEAPESKRYYRYLHDAGAGVFVGEIAYHYDTQREIHICDVIILAKYRKQGFGMAGIQLLCEAAKENGISVLYDDIAADNPSYRLFLRNGFEICSQNDDVILVRKAL